jgi:glycosyltransferase involved in cell wall biosynthesis
MNDSVVDPPWKRPPSQRVLTVVRWPVGGIRTYVLYSYPTLAAAGYQFTFVGPADASFRAFREELRGWNGAEFIEAPLHGRRCKLRSTVRQLLRSGRYALVHSQGLTAAAQVALANLGLAVPHVVTSHDVFRPRHVAGVLGRCQLWTLGRLLRRADAVVNVSEDARQNLLEYVPALRNGPGRLVTIRNGIDMGRLSGPGEESAQGLRKLLGIDDDVVLLGFLGRFMEQKGFLPLLDALERLVARAASRRFHLVAVGSGDYEREYRREVERHGLTGCITFLPFTADAGSILRQLDVLVVPSLWEACPLLPMEAMAVGVPVLGSDCIGLREVLRDTPSVMVAARDVEAWNRTLGKTIDQPWTEAAQAFLPEARRRFDVASSAERLRQLFDDVVEKPEHGRATLPRRAAGAPHFDAPALITATPEDD